MRLVFTFCAALFIVLGSIRSATAAPTTSLDLRADRIVYYSNRFIVTGEGDVRIRLSDGTRLTGELFSMDLKLNRFLLAGDVHIDGSDGVHDVGAAFAGYPDLDRSYFFSATESPDKWTFFGLDFAHPNKGRAQPSDAFFIPDVSLERPYIVATSAMILPKSSVAFNGARLYELGVSIPVQKWVQIFSANPNYYQNGFAGATFDIGIPYNGSLHALSQIHIRYTGMSKLFLSFDQHFVWDRDYIVFSVNPATQTTRQFNLIGYKRISPKMEARIFAQLTTAQHGIYQPGIASTYMNLTYNVALPHSSVNLSADQYNNSLLLYPPATNGDGAQAEAYDHPADFQVAWTSRDTPITRFTPINIRLRSGYGYAHDGYHCGPIFNDCPGDPKAKGATDLGEVLDYFGRTQTPVTTITQKFVGATLFTNSLPLDKLHSLNFNITVDKQRQWFSLPHYIDATTSTASLSKLYTRKLAFLAAYSVAQLADVYGARQLEFYPPYQPTPSSPALFDPYNGKFYPGYNAFRGISTSRSLTGAAIITPNQFFNYAFIVRHERDFPTPVPGLFGLAPWSVTNEFRFRLTKQILVDLTRTDYFNFGGFTPQFNLQFGP